MAYLVSRAHDFTKKKVCVFEGLCMYSAAALYAHNEKLAAAVHFSTNAIKRVIEVLQNSQAATGKLGSAIAHLTKDRMR